MNVKVDASRWLHWDAVQSKVQLMMSGRGSGGNKTLVCVWLKSDLPENEAVQSFGYAGIPHWEIFAN